MDVKLLLKIIISEGIIVLVMALSIGYIIRGENQEFDIMYYLLSALTYLMLEYYDYFRIGRELGIQKGDEDYLKTNYHESIESSIEKEKLIEIIRDSNQYFGKVTLNNKIIRRQKFKGFDRMSKSEIEFVKVGDKQLVKLSTKPYTKTTLVDYYANYKCFKLLRSIIKAYA